MPIPFPGMNPYLEHPDLWPSVHQKMMAALADTLERQLPLSYKIRLQERQYQVSGEDSLVVGSPSLSWDLQASSPADLQADAIPNLPTALPAGGLAATSSEVSPCFSPSQPIPVLIAVPQKIYETYLEIVNLAGETVTIIEALSPNRKRPGRGRTLYERYRETIFGSTIHFVEIDLLRGWEPPFIYGPDEAGDYRILVSRSEQRPRAELYIWTVAEAIPQIVVPLSGQEGLSFCLKSVVDQAGDRTDLLVNYQQAPLPPLRHQEDIWLEDFLQKVGMRPCAS